MTRKQVRNQVRRALGDQDEQRFRVHAFRQRGRCVVVVHRCSRQPQERGKRRYVGIGRDWAHASRQAASGLMVEP
jgi:hypothetical protein